jgi:TPR repeat protein
MKELFERAEALYNEKKYAEAAPLYREAADGGIPEAQHRLAYMYYNGRGVEKNKEEYVRLNTLAAEQGYGPAEFSLASAYQLGFDVEGSREKAVYWYKRAAEHGNVKAALYIGYYYETGYGVEISLPEAMKWWKRAVDMSGGACCEAAYKLGHYNLDGIDGVRDLSAAYYYLKLAEKHGYSCGDVVKRVEKELSRKDRR